MRAVGNSIRGASPYSIARFTRLAPLSILRIPAVGRDVKLRNTGSRGIPRKPGKEENRGPSQEKGQRRGILTGNGFHSWRIVKLWFKIRCRYVFSELNIAIIICERNISLFGSSRIICTHVNWIRNESKHILNFEENVFLLAFYSIPSNYILRRKKDNR